MRLIHCHRELVETKVAQLLGILKFESSCVVLREKALKSCNNAEILKQLEKITTVYFLNDQSSVKFPEKLNPQVITYAKFVDLCIKAEQVVGWN